MRLYQVTFITLVFVLFEGGWYILILPVGTRFSMFFVLRFGLFDVGASVSHAAAVGGSVVGVVGLL